ncbi:MAG TPA: hypothetical protein VE244_11020 [Nitrososphaeraceae archaeon]|nr:hypothetical protein [Nitrososphaeraceae archaeon]
MVERILEEDRPLARGKDVPSCLRGNYKTQTTEPDKSVGYSLTKLKMHM